MNPIILKNETGKSIEVKWDADGDIEVRHSDIDKVQFGKLHQFEQRSRQAGLKDALFAKGVDPSNPLMKELLPKMGSYLVMSDQSYTINAQETAMILAAVKQRGGILPNWRAHQ